MYPRPLIDILPITCKGNSNGIPTKAVYIGRYPLKVGKRPSVITRSDISTRLFIDSEFSPKFVKDEKIDLDK